MRPLLMSLSALSLLAFAACDASTSPQGSVAADVLAGKQVLDDSGHPLLLANTDPGVAVFETELLRLVNDHRLALGLSPLTPSTLLGDAARAHARHMIQHRFVAHASPEGFTPRLRLDLAGLPSVLVGENIAATFSTPQAVFEAWMNSPAHRANLDSPEFTHAGAGYALDAAPLPEFPYVHYWAMAFLKQ